MISLAIMKNVIRSDNPQLESVDGLTLFCAVCMHSYDQIWVPYI